MNQTEDLLKKVLGGYQLRFEEAVSIYLDTPDAMLFYYANEFRKRIHPGGKVGWIIDRNVNITNVCYSFCKFCNFCRKSSDEDSYITSLDQYRAKIRELFKLGGNQLLLQGGMHPKLGLDYYTGLFKQLKEEFPQLRLHALGPPEVVHLAKMEGRSYRDILRALLKSGMDSLPGAGAEILVDRIRQRISPAKGTVDEWLEVMREAHKLNIITSATMMYGHVEEPGDRIEHLIKLREVQDEKPEGSYGFLSFIPWPYMDEGTLLREKEGVRANYDRRSYLRLIAISRLVLTNVIHIQASWLTAGRETGQLGLHTGADDFGSIMIEENVVSSAGASNKMDAVSIKEAIIEAGFEPYQRNQLFESIG